MLVKKGSAVISLLITTALVCTSIYANGGSEAAASTTGHGKYLAGQGIIIPPQQVYVDSYIASVDYRYPIPEESIGLTLYSGHRQISNKGQEEIIQVGIQGGKVEFDELPPMNIAFVIDKSGSMGSQDKMDWVKESFYIFIESVRESDFVSLVVFDNTAQVVFPTTRMDSRDKRLKFKEAVRRISPGGGTNLIDGLEQGYGQVMANFRSDYTNRVLFLTDGVGKSNGLLDMAETYRELGVNVSTIGLGRDFDLELMDNLARAGGGSSRFVADREEMEKIFGSELDRAFVAVARDLEVTLDLAPGVNLLETWGYNHQVSGDQISYFLPTLHHGDYETILARVAVEPSVALGEKPLFEVSLKATDLDGQPIQTDPTFLEVEFVNEADPVVGYSDAMILRSGTILDYAESLILIGELYYDCREEIDETNYLRDEIWRNQSENPDISESSYENLTSPRIQELERSIAAKMDRAMDLAVSMKKVMENVRLRLDNEGFEDELDVMEKYIRILGEELELDEERVTVIVQDREINPNVSDRNFSDHMDNLFKEMTLDLKTRSAGTVAVSGFTMSDGNTPSLVTMLNESAVVEFGRIDTLTLVERGRLEVVLEEQSLQLTGLVDTNTAIRVGELLAAEFIVTGSVIEMASSGGHFRSGDQRRNS
jgi:hypothetical protein